MENLNTEWKQFVKISMIFPLSQIGLIIMLIVQLWGIISGVMDNSTMLDEKALFSVMFTNSIGIIVTLFLFLISQVGYVLWFIFKCDHLFLLLEKNRLTFNIINVIGLWFGGLSILLMPIYLMMSVKSFWNKHGISYNWLGFKL